MNGMDGLDLVAKVLGLKGGCWVGVGGGVRGQIPGNHNLDDSAENGRGGRAHVGEPRNLNGIRMRYFARKIRWEAPPPGAR